MITWKILWQLMFLLGFVAFVYIFIVFTYRGYFELKKLIGHRNE